MGMPSVPQLLIILVIVVLIFGAKRLKNLGGDLGSAVKGFKEAVKDNEGKDKATADLEDATNQASAEASELANRAEETVMNKTDDQKSS